MVWKEESPRLGGFFTTNASRLVTQVFEMNILELNGHGWTCVQLKCEDAGIGSMGCILIHDDGGHPAIDHVHEAILVGDDMIVIPVFLLDFILNTCRSTQGCLLYTSDAADE